MENLFAAFDLSTTVVGYSFFSIDTGDLVICNYLKFQADDLVERAFELMKFIDDNVKTNNVKEFVIEERLKSFREGGTNADAMLKTAQLNFFCQVYMRTIGVTVNEINVMNARATCFPGFHKVARATKGLKHKDLAFEYAVKELGENFFPKKILKSGPRKGQEIYLEEAKDMADSWVLGQAYIKKRL